MAIARVETSVGRIGNDSVYGHGGDGTVVISSNTSLSRDMYYLNLTINSGVTLNTNGFRVFVKNTLTVNGTIGISAGATATTGTVAGTTAIATSTTNSLGGSAAGATYTASAMSPSVYGWLESLLNGGVRISPSGTFTVTGGAGGQNGAAGTVTAATAGSGATSGGAGGTGQLPSRSALQPGGPGTAGTPGSNGVAGTNVPAASAGVAGIGGGIVFIAAKVIAGTGAIRSEGQNAVAGGASATGTGATNGAAGSAGTAAPNIAVAHYTDNHLHYDYPGGHTTASAPALPHGHQGANTAYEHNQVYRWVHGNYIHHSNHRGHNNHSYMCPGGHEGNFSHGYNAYNFGSTTGANVYSYYYINSIPHTPHQSMSHTGNYNDTGVVFPHCSWVEGYGKDGSPYYAHGAWPRQHYDRTDTYSQTSPTSVKHVGHTTKYGGTAGTAGSAGTNGTNGSTTAGTNGQSGGGGGIVCITDDSIPGSITTSTAGGTLSSVSGSSGTLVTIINK
jgi:hypothetical protein